MCIQFLQFKLVAVTVLTTDEETKQIDGLVLLKFLLAYLCKFLHEYDKLTISFL